MDTVFLADNESTDDSVEKAIQGHSNVVVSSYSSGGRFDEQLKQKILHQKRAECAGKYDYVLLLDNDEFVVPKGGRLIRETIEAAGSPDVLGTDGWSIFGYPGDAPYDPSKTLFEQRRWGLPQDYYSKPIVCRPGADLKFNLGNHIIENIPGCRPKVVPFWLFHYKGFDEEISIARTLRLASRLVYCPGHTYLNITEKDLRLRFHSEKDRAKPIQIVPEKIP